MNDKTALRGLIAAIGYLVACLLLGPVGAWAEHGLEDGLASQLIVALAFVLWLGLGVFAGLLAARNAWLKLLAVVCYLFAGFWAFFVSGVSVACGVYQACL